MVKKVVGINLQLDACLLAIIFHLSSCYLTNLPYTWSYSDSSLLHFTTRIALLEPLAVAMLCVLILRGRTMSGLK